MPALDFLELARVPSDGTFSGCLFFGLVVPAEAFALFPALDLIGLCSFE